MLIVYSNHLFVPAASYEFMPLTSNIHSIKVFIIFSLYNKIIMQYTQENTVVDNMLPSQDALDLSLIGTEDLRTEIFEFDSTSSSCSLDMYVNSSKCLMSKPYRFNITIKYVNAKCYISNSHL